MQDDLKAFIEIRFGVITEMFLLTLRRIFMIFVLYKCLIYLFTNVK
jgi:hypothetical protein